MKQVPLTFETLEVVQYVPQTEELTLRMIVNDGKQILDMLLNPNFQLNAKIVLEKPISTRLPDLSSDRQDVRANQYEVKYLDYKEQESRIEVRTQRDGLLFVSDTFYPGWKAYVNGVETKIYKADFAFRAVKVPRGDHEIRFIYKVKSVTLSFL